MPSPINKGLIRKYLSEVVSLRVQNFSSICQLETWLPSGEWEGVSPAGGAFKVFGVYLSAASRE